MKKKKARTYRIIRVEISYTTNPDEYPEHHGYYDTAEKAKEAIDEIFEMEEREVEDDD